MTPHHTTLRRKIFEVMSQKSGSTTTVIFSWVLTIMVLANVTAVVLESVHWIREPFSEALYVFEAVSIAFFSIEYLLRLWTAVEFNAPGEHTSLQKRLGYALSFHGLVDLIAILPFFFQHFMPGVDLRFLRIVRTMRILKLSHYNSALEDLIGAIYSERDSFISAIYLLAITILLSSCMIYYVEHNLQPEKFGSIPESMWWSVITLTTVGYGDAAPISGLGKLIGAFTAFSGVLTVALLTGIVASAFSTRMRREEIEFESEVSEALRSGGMTTKEQETLERLRREFGITQNHAEAIIQRIREETSNAIGKNQRKK